MVFQNYALYPHMTVRENIASRSRSAKLPKEEIEAASTRAAGSSTSSRILDRKPRAAFRRPATARGDGPRDRPRAAVFLMDEPLSNLDAKLRVQMRAEIKRSSASSRRRRSTSRTTRSRR